jgi:hypothetical protein
MNFFPKGTCARCGRENVQVRTVGKLLLCNYGEQTVLHSRDEETGLEKHVAVCKPPYEEQYMNLVKANAACLPY